MDRLIIHTEPALSWNTSRTCCICACSAERRAALYLINSAFTSTSVRCREYVSRVEGFEEKQATNKPTPVLVSRAAMPWSICTEKRGLLPLRCIQNLKKGLARYGLHNVESIKLLSGSKPQLVLLTYTFTYKKKQNKNTANCLHVSQPI